jgi:D-alanyl-D-alanine endopeptidase (penicillin-binding protein 7)
MIFTLFLKIIMMLSAGPEIPVLSYSTAVIRPIYEAKYPEISANKAVVFSPTDRAFFFQKNSREVQAIASISKLMTALVFLDHNPSWDESYIISSDDKIEGGRLNLFPGDEVTISDLFKTSLIASDNGATIALVHASGLDENEFVVKMNEKASKLGLTNTFFTDPIGLSDKNVSSAREIAILAQEALSRPEIKEAVSLAEYSYLTVSGREKKIESTDHLLFAPENKGLKSLGGKTGYTDEAGYCFVGKFLDEKGKEFISVVLDSQDKNSRFIESRDLVISVLKNYEISR